MKKTSILLFIAINLISCKVKHTNNNDEFLILNKIFSQLILTEINLISEPDNNTILKYSNGGFIDNAYNIYNCKFDFKNNKALKWDKRLTENNKKLREKVVFIIDKTHIPKIEKSDIINSQVLYCVSNVLFSDDGKYAIVNMNSFSNLPVAQYFECHLLIFKRENDDWVFISEIMPMTL